MMLRTKNIELDKGKKRNGRRERRVFILDVRCEIVLTLEG